MRLSESPKNPYIDEKTSSYIKQQYSDIKVVKISNLNSPKNFT